MVVDRSAQVPDAGPAVLEDPRDHAPPVRFFTIADAGYALGLMALVNSLRLQGHHDPVTVLDLGMTADQKALIGRSCELVTPTPDAVAHPWLMEPYAATLRTAETVVYIDSDVIITDSLNPILDAAAGGRICAFPDYSPDRWFAEWESIFGLPAAPRRQTYVNAGFLALSTEHHPGVLDRWLELCRTISDHPNAFDIPHLDSPTAFTSQDALNALLMSEVAEEHLHIQSVDAAAQGPQLMRTRLDDPRTLRCSSDGHRITLLHAFGSTKPWKPEARSDLRRSSYVLGLRRLLVGDDVETCVPDPLLPPWLRRGWRGWMWLTLVSARTRLRLHRRASMAKTRRGLSRRRATRHVRASI